MPSSATPGSHDDIATANDVLLRPTTHIKRESNLNPNSTHEARTETDAKNMVTNTATNEKVSPSRLTAKNAVGKAKATVARITKVRSTSKAKDAPTVEPVTLIESVSQPVAAEIEPTSGRTHEEITTAFDSVYENSTSAVEPSAIWPRDGEKPSAFAQDAPVTTVDAQVPAGVWQPEAPGETKDAHWSHLTGGTTSLSPEAKEQAKVEYVAFGQKNPTAAAKYNLDQYVTFRQGKFAKRQLKAAELGTTSQGQSEASTAKEPDMPSEKHWSRQVNFAAMSPDQVAGAAADYAKFATKNPEAGKAHNLESYANYVIDRSAENRSLGIGLRRCEANVDRGAVSFTDNKQADAVLKEAYGQKRTGVEALRVLQQSVEPGQAQTRQFKDAFNITVERSKDNKIVRTTLTPLAGKETAVKELIRTAAIKAFVQARASEPRAKQVVNQQQDLGR